MELNVKREREKWKKMELSESTGNSEVYFKRWSLQKYIEQMFNCQGNTCTHFNDKSGNKACSLFKTLPSMLSSSTLILRQSTWLLSVENTDVSSLSIVSWAFSAQIFGRIVLHQTWHSRTSDLSAREGICLPQSLLCGDDVFFEPPKVVVPSIFRRFPAISLSEMTRRETLLQL